MDVNYFLFFQILFYDFAATVLSQQYNKVQCYQQTFFTYQGQHMVNWTMYIAET